MVRPALIFDATEASERVPVETRGALVSRFMTYLKLGLEGLMGCFIPVPHISTSTPLAL